MSGLDLLLTRCRLPDGSETDLGCRDGLIAEVGALAGRPAPRIVDCGGRLVTPGLVEAHIHLDKALLARRVRPARTLAEAISVTAEAKRRFTVEDIRARARQVLDLAVRAGTTAMRSHVEVDPGVGLAGLEALLPLREQYAPALALQLCAFAQEGITNLAGTEALLARALRAGADSVGGCPYTDPDPRGHVEAIFRLARDFDVDADFHVDLGDDPERLHVRHVLEATLRHGWQGRVTVGHLTEMAALPPGEQEALARELAAASIGVIVLPATDLYLTGRGDARNVRRGLAPVRRLLAAGVAVAAASNNVQNPFTPVGNADPLLMGYLLAVAAHMGTPDDLRRALDALTIHPARILRLPAYGLEVGCRADLVVWEAERPEDVVATLAPRRLVVRAGRVTVEGGPAPREPWRRLAEDSGTQRA